MCDAIAWHASYLYALWYDDVAINDDFVELIDISQLKLFTYL